MGKQRKIREQGTVNEVVSVRATLDLDEPTYDAYAEQAMKRNLEPETVMAERLRIAKTWIDGGIHFNAAQAKRLSTAVGHTVSDAEGALQRLETIGQIVVDGVVIQLEPRVLQRLKSRVFRGQTLEGVIRREVLLGLKRFCGLEPA